MRDYVLIYVNGQRHEVRGEDCFRSLSDFLRLNLGLTGAKIVCAEGDCGSCSVLLGKAAGERIDYKPVCSCIAFVYQLDCAHVITVEGLKDEGKLNAVQEAMVNGQGAQCGFCTPGFVVSLCGLMDQQSEVSQEDVRRACVGNLCRCTGYEPIIRAGTSVNPQTMKPLNQLYLPGEMLGEFAAGMREGVEVIEEDRRFFKPIDVASACAFRRDHPDCTVVAGATDIGVQVNKGLRDPKVILSLNGLHELEAVKVADGVIVAGARASISDLETLCREHLSEYAKLLYWFGSPPIKNAGTIGGNIANGSPIGDTMPAMFVLNAEIELTGINGARRVNINDFYSGYRQTVMRGDEIITRVFIPLPGSEDVFKLYKISRRKDLDISAFTAAVWMKRDGGKIAEVRIAYGGVAPTIIRLVKTEAFLRGRALDESSVEEAGRIARSEVKPISDVRGSADYRLQLSENILHKLLADLSEMAPVMY